MKKILIVFFICLILLPFVRASAPAPAPKCYIKGIIQSFEFKEAYNESCVNDNINRCPTDMELYHPDRYFLNVTIKEVSYIEGTTEYSTCEELFPINENKIIFINKENVRAGDQFIQNKQIEGQTPPQTPPYWGRGYLESYTLKEPTSSNIQNIIYLIIVIIIILLAILITYFFIKKKK